MREAVSDLGAQRQYQSLLLKIGIHEGSCLAVTLNDQQDYFGQTVNIASRVQGLAASRSIVATEQVVENTQASALLKISGLKPTLRRATLGGIADEMSVYEIP
jgi:class 3 adenylate cyclase